MASLRVAVVAFLVGLTGSNARLAAQAHDHRTRCVDLKPGGKRGDTGCWNIGVLRSLEFAEPAVYWHVRRLATRSAADAAKGARGLVAEEAGQVWLSTFGPRDMAAGSGEAVAVVGPLQLPQAKTYDVVLSYAVMRPGERSPVHTHPGPEAWYVLAGEQCLETGEGAKRASAGEAMAVGPNMPMELNVVGTAVRRSLVVVLHDSAQARSIQSDWKPTGACRR